MRRYLTAACVTLLLGGASHAQRSGQPNTAISTAIEGELTQCLDCQKCENQSLHQVFEDIEIGNSYGSSGHSHCSAIGSCFSGHANHTWLGEGQCQPLALTETDLRRLSLAAQNADAVELRSLSTRYSDSVRPNLDRSALQLVGCSGRIVAQFPVPRDLLEGLVADE